MENSIIIFILTLFSIPEPGLYLYGYIRDDSCLLAGGAKMTWSFTPVRGGDAVSVRTLVRPIENESNLYVYRALVPLSTPIKGIPAPKNKIRVSYQPDRYVRSLTIEGSSLVKTDPIMLSARDRGRFRRWSIVW